MKYLRRFFCGVTVYLLTIISLLVAALLCGCQQQKAPEAFPFSLPESITLVDAAGSACSLSLDNQKIGGIVCTDMKEDNLKDEDGLIAYFEAIAPLPQTFEYISMFSEDGNYWTATLKITNPDTNVKTYSHHYFFLREGAIYDLWMDDSLVDEKQQEEIINYTLMH